jgi:hypothetical protein
MTSGSFVYLDEEDDFEDPDDVDERYYEEDDGESGLEYMARVAAEAASGRAEIPPGWKLDRSHPGMLVWTTPSGRRYASTLEGDSLPLP